MSNNYDVFKMYLKITDFQCLILKLPEEELNDKLTILSAQNGNISKSFYEDFVVSNVVANVNQLIYHIRQKLVSPQTLIQIRIELINCIIDINPLLDPKNLVINKNFVVKIKENDILKEGEKLLIDNSNWKDKDFENIVKEYEDEFYKYLNNEEDQIDTKVTEIEDLEYKINKQWWPLLTQYISIKEFEDSDTEFILSKKYFHNKDTFHTYIVSISIVDFESLFAKLDDMGVPHRISSQQIMEELYNLCILANKNLTFENAQRLLNNNFDGHSSPKRKSLGDNKKNKRGQVQKKLFKDVNKTTLLSLEKDIKEKLIGQDNAVKQVVDSIQRARVGLQDPEKPIGSFLFSGSTGCGKTEFTKVLTEKLINDKRHRIVIDCSEFTSDHEYSKLIGAPSGYVGYESGGLLTNAVKKYPFSVIVFDEVEKASTKVHELMLQILDSGRLTDGKGEAVKFNNTIIIMTSNIGVSEVKNIEKTIGFGDVAFLTETKKNNAISKGVEKKFKPEFLNRIDSIIYFKSLTRKDYNKIIQLELEHLNDNLNENDTEYNKLMLNFNKNLYDFIYKKGVNKKFGARPLKRAISKYISTPLAQKLLMEESSTESDIKISTINNKIVFDINNRIKDVPFYLSGDYKQKNNKQEVRQVEK